MRAFSNYHTHSTFCDGRDTPEEMVREAIRLGCPELGFSGHSHVSFDDCCMTLEGSAAYINTIRALQEKYEEQIRILLGIEQDIYSDMPTDTLGLDYVIGAVHYVYKDGEYLSVDLSREDQIRNVQWHYDGDFYAFAEEYYRTVARVYEVTHCDIIAHFDLITKFNEGNVLFDPTHPRYRAAALSALEALRETPAVFEINTGAMARGYRTSPYPDPFILDILCRSGRPLILSSDCHDKRYLLHGFDDLYEQVPNLLKKLPLT